MNNFMMIGLILVIGAIPFPSLCAGAHIYDRVWQDTPTWAMYLLMLCLVHNFLHIFNRLLVDKTTRTLRRTYLSHLHLRRRQLWCWYISIFGWQRAARWIILDGFSKQATSQNPDFGPQLNCGIQLSTNFGYNGSHATVIKDDRIPILESTLLLTHILYSESLMNKNKQ